jgi:hypothetical protein
VLDAAYKSWHTGTKQKVDQGVFRSGTKAS